jgi:hypothetical protein
MRTHGLIGLLVLVLGVAAAGAARAEEQTAQQTGAATKAGAPDPPQEPRKDRPPFPGGPGGRFGHSGRSGEGPDFWGDKDLNDMVTTIMVVRLSRELELNNEQTIVLVRHLQELRDEMMRVGKERYEALKALKDAIDANAADDTLRQRLDAVMELDRKRTELRQTTFEKASRGLSLKQQAKLYYFVQEFEGQMRRMIQRVMESRADRLMQWRGEEGEPSKADAAAKESLTQKLREELQRNEAGQQSGSAGASAAKPSGE